MQPKSKSYFNPGKSILDAKLIKTQRFSLMPKIPNSSLKDKSVTAITGGFS